MNGQSSFCGKKFSQPQINMLRGLHGYELVGKHPSNSFEDIKHEFFNSLLQFPDESLFSVDLVRWAARSAQKYSIVDK